MEAVQNHTCANKLLKYFRVNKLENKVAIITGASKGISASIAKHFAAAGAKVVVNKDK